VAEDFKPVICAEMFDDVAHEYEVIGRQLAVKVLDTPYEDVTREVGDVQR
jgi:hypothetical protein